jgi:alkylation response protein AidB-like acyl-CoA dehydrogenase
VPEYYLTFCELLDVAISRLDEFLKGHVNAFKLISLFGNDQQIERAAKDLEAGQLFAIWNAEAENGVRLSDASSTVLTGAKVFCSAAGHVTRAVITARVASATRMLLVSLEPGERIVLGGIGGLHGMRATQTAGIDFDGIEISADAFIGGPDDYLREPAFSAGAWRTCAVALGGLDALIDETRGRLLERKRHRDPHQLSRMGQVLIARESARMWIERTACLDETDLPSADITG